MEIHNTVRLALHSVLVIAPSATQSVTLHKYTFDDFDSLVAFALGKQSEGARYPIDFGSYRISVYFRDHSTSFEDRKYKDGNMDIGEETATNEDDE